MVIIIIIILGKMKEELSKMGFCADGIAAVRAMSASVDPGSGALFRFRNCGRSLSDRKRC